MILSVSITEGGVRMAIPPQGESVALRNARVSWLDSVDQYKREVGLATEPLRSIEERLQAVNATRQEELISQIRQRREAYEAALRAEGRPVPHH